MPRLDKSLVAAAKRLREDVSRAASGERLLRHVPTGFTAFDDEFGGIQLGVATELMAHTGDGKSAFARQVAEATARAGGGVLWFCGEDPEDSTAARYFADGTGIPATQMGRLDLDDGQLDRIDATAKKAAVWAARVDIRFGPVSVQDILEAVDKAEPISGAPLKLVIVDYIQVMAEARNLEDDIAQLALGMNARAGNMKIAVLLLSQVSTDNLKRAKDHYRDTREVSGFTPGLGDTEWCKRAEKSTKAVLALVRPNRWRREMGEDVADDCAELWVRKANFGAMGWVPLGWNGPMTRFENK